MKKLIALAAVIVIAAIGVAFKAISKEDINKEVRTEVASAPHTLDIGTKEHTGWD